MNLDNLVPAREILSGEILELLKGRDDMLVLDHDRANETGMSLVAESMPDKFLMIGAAETNVVGVAAGLAAMGMTIWLAGFNGAQLRQSLQQWNSIIGPAKLNVKLVAYSGNTSSFDCAAGCEFQDIAMMRSVPNMTIVVPGDAVEARQAIRAVCAQDGPAYIRLTGLPPEALCGDDYSFQTGHAITLRNGADVAMICTGRQTRTALHAATILDTVEISALVLHVPTIQPLDVAAIAAAAESVRLVVTAEEHGIQGGLGEAVAEALAPKHLKLLARFGFPRTYDRIDEPSGTLEEKSLSAPHMAETIHDLLRRC